MYSPAVSSRPYRPLVLGDILPKARWRDAALVIGGALLTVLGAQISIPLPNSPVPITGQTLAVVVAGASLGAWRGASSQALYLVMGLFLPVFSNGGQGWQTVFGATGGFLVAFPLVAGLHDRFPQCSYAKRCRESSPSVEFEYLYNKITI